MNNKNISDLPSVSSLPSKWRIVRLKNICTFNYGDSLSDEKRIDGEVPVYGSNGIVGRHNVAITTAPCIIIGRKGSYGKVNYSTEPCFPIDTTYWIDKYSTNSDLRWLSYVLPLLELDTNSQDSAVPGLSREVAHEKRLPLPSSLEQHRIAAYLDQQTAKIDRLINLRQRQIALLKEQRAALIQQAVTRGLNPDVPMKDSGLPWLGEIPAHWDMVRMKMLAESLIAGPFGSSIKKDMYVQTGYRVYGQEQVIPADFSIGDYFITADKFIEMKRYSVLPGDVLISCVGSFGKIAVVPNNIYPGIINPRLLRLRPLKRLIIPEYLGTVLRSSVGYTQMEQEGRGGTMDVINIGLLGQLCLPLPPKEEQCFILEFIANQCSKLDTLSSTYSRQITLLTEYRAALIHECVTGQRVIPDHFNTGG